MTQRQQLVSLHRDTSWRGGERKELGVGAHHEGGQVGWRTFLDRMHHGVLHFRIFGVVELQPANADRPWILERHGNRLVGCLQHENSEKQG